MKNSFKPGDLVEAIYGQSDSMGNRFFVAPGMCGVVINVRTAIDHDTVSGVVMFDGVLTSVLLKDWMGTSFFRRQHCVRA